VSRASVESSAPGKVILFGEHAVVYGEPAIAVPVSEVEARATIEPAPPDSGLSLVAADLGQRFTLSGAPQQDPLALAARLTLSRLSAPVPDATIIIRSSIPIASGLGSGAAVSTALVRALAEFLGHSLSPAAVSELVFEVEKIHHGTPSGIDNTVIAYEQPVYFVRTAISGPQLISVGAPFALVIADTGLPSPTKRLVSQVRTEWQRDRAHYGMLFEKIGAVAREAHRKIRTGDVKALGPLMDRNHALLIQLGVSSPALNKLVDTARDAGALGAKLSGAGQGGNMLALVDAGGVEDVAGALREAGATHVIHTIVE
jgi:mevalonate kinase